MPKKYSEELHNCVQDVRKQRGVTQQELANAIDVTRQTIFAIEKGNYVPSVLLALKIANHFDVPLEDIFSYTE